MAEQASDVIFFEKQEQGSMLCAQHTLNNLLQQPIFSASELGSIAEQLDAAEASISNSERRNKQGKTSQNMDDSGFFSVQVLIEALKVFDVKLVPWKSKNMDEAGIQPEDQQAFIFHGNLHWFSMRRFASNPDYFVDLDSCLDCPKRVGPAYLRMRINQAENEGYTIFSIVPNYHDTTRLTTAPSFSMGTVLPRSPADDYPTSLFEQERHTRRRGEDNEDNSGSQQFSRPIKRIKKPEPKSESAESVHSASSSSSIGELSVEELRRRRVARFQG